MIKSIQDIPIEDRYISQSLIEKMLDIPSNQLIKEFIRIFRTPANNKGIKNVTITSLGKMTFLPKGKKSVVSLSGNWTTENRQEGNYGRTLRKLLKENGVKDIVDKDLEEIVNKLKALFTVEGEFTVVTGWDIQKYYHGDNYDHSFNIGTLSNSCMRHSGACQEACNFFAQNSNISMVVLMAPDKDKIRGRALLWTDREGNKFMDRIYANDHITEAFKEYAKSKDWAYKKRQHSSPSSWVFPNGEERDVDVYVDLEESNYSIYPYMDTLCYIGSDYITNDSGALYNTFAQSEPSEYEGGIWDEIAECYIDEDEAIYLEYRDCYTHMDSVIYSSVDGLDYYQEDVVELENGSWIYYEHEDLITLSDGRHYLISEVSECNFDGELYPDEELVFNEDLGITVHPDNEDAAYDDAGWVQDEFGTWVEELEEA